MDTVLLILDNKVRDGEHSKGIVRDKIYKLIMSGLFKEVIYSKLINTQEELINNNKLSKEAVIEIKSRYNLDDLTMKSKVYRHVERSKFSAFNSTLDFLLETLVTNKNKSVIFLCGFGIDNSLIHTVADLESRGYNPILLEQYSFHSTNSIFNKHIDLNTLLSKEQRFGGLINLESSLRNIRDLKLFRFGDEYYD